MYQSGLGPGSSRGDDARPILTGRTDSKGWITSLKDYVNSMKECCPDDIHPDEEWLANGFSMISLDQGQSAAATSAQQGGLATVRHMVRDKVSLPMEDMCRRLDKHTRRHTANELYSRQVHLNQ